MKAHAAKAPPAAQRQAAKPDSKRGADADAEPPSAPNRLWRALAFGAQAKLAVSSPGDPAEVEADRIADQMMRMPSAGFAPADGATRLAEPALRRTCAACAAAAPAKCPACRDEEADGIVLRAAAGRGRPAGLDAGLLAGSLGRGAPLARPLRAFFEPRLGTDLGRVRVHTDAAAAHAARQLHARAFAYGPHVAFADGEYAPDSTAGRRLLAHELVHVAQQGAAPSAVVQRSPDDPALVKELDGYIEDAAADADQDDDLLLRARASRLALLLTWKLRPTLSVQADLDAFVEDCEGLADTEMDTLNDFSPAGAELAMAGYPKGFPLTWSGRVHAALTLGVDPTTIVLEWIAELQALKKKAGPLDADIFAHGLPLGFDDVGRAASFKLRVSDAAAEQASSVRDFAKAGVRYVQIRWISSFAVAWEGAVDEIAEAVADGTVVVDYLDWKDFVNNKQAKLRELPARARDKIAADDAGVEQLQTDAVAFGDAALAAGMFGGLAALFSILKGWSEVQDLFDGELKEADALVAGAGGTERVWTAMKWAWDNGYLSGAAKEMGRSLIDNGPEMLAETAAILIAGRIPGLNIAVGIYLAFTTARDVLHLIDAFGTAMNDAIQADTVAKLQKAAKSLAQVGVAGGFAIGVVLATLGIAKVAGKIRKRSAELRAADAALAEEAAEKRALAELTAEERKAIEEGPAKTAKKFEQFGGVCSIGSINCRGLPANVKSEAGTYPTAGGVPMPGGRFTVQKAVLAGVDRSPKLLRSIVLAEPARWPEFEKALAAAKKKGLDWPVDKAGKPWQVHHVKPVFMGGGNDIDNLFPLPEVTHQQYTNWWNGVHRAFRKRFTDVEWDEIYWNEKSVPGSKVPKNPK